MSAVPAGSYLVVCPAASDIDDVREMTRRYNQMPAVPLTHRTRAQAAGFFTGLELTGPGVAPLSTWVPGTASTLAALRYWPQTRYRCRALAGPAAAGTRSLRGQLGGWCFSRAAVRQVR